MKIIEVRDSYIKLESEVLLPLTSFVLVKSSAKNYVAQILQTKNLGAAQICYAKILYIYDGMIQKYDNSQPEKDSLVSEFNFDIINSEIKPHDPIIVGKFSSNNILAFDKTSFDKKTFISVDNSDNNKKLIENISKQFKNSVIIDMLGIFKTSDKITAGVDFKLPLNTDSLEFMYEDCLNDATSDSKSLVKEIFKDLADYSKTVDFLPFSALKTIVDDMVDRAHVFKLLVLKNKLAKFDKLGYFAANSNEVNFLYTTLTSGNKVIDLSKLDPLFQNRYLATILNILKQKSPNTQIFVEVSNSITKKNLKTLLCDETLKSVLVSHSRFKYFNELKSMFSNFILEPTITNKEAFKIYSALFNSMTPNNYFIVGEDTNYLPFVVDFQDLNIETEIAENAELSVSSEELTPEIDSDDSDDNIADEQTTDLTELIEEEENPSSEIESSSESPIEVIEKKSEEFIDKVSEEIQNELPLRNPNIFISDEQEDEYTVEPESEEVSDSLDLEITTELTEDELVIEPSIQGEISENIITESDLNETEQADDIGATTDEYHTQIDEIQAIDVPEEISEITEETKAPEIIEFQEENIEEIEDSQELNTDSIGFKEFSEESEYIAPIPNSASIEDVDKEFDEIIEINDTDISDEDILIDINEDEDNIELLDEELLDRQIVEDVDKVFTTMRDNSISDSDLDFIDELNSTNETEEILLTDGIEELSGFDDLNEDNEEFIENVDEIVDYRPQEEKEVLQTKKSTTPIVPVYGAEIPPEDIVMSDPIEQGDMVTHAKYGSGVVEKMIKYGTKTLYSINFDNIGRRLLDPTLTEIKKS